MSECSLHQFSNYFFFFFTFELSEFEYKLEGEKRKEIMVEMGRDEERMKEGRKGLRL